MPEILDLPKFNYEDLLQVNRVPLELIGNASRYIHGHPKTQNLQTADCRPRRLCRPCSISIVFYWSVVQTSVYGKSSEPQINWKGYFRIENSIYTYILCTKCVCEIVTVTVSRHFVFLVPGHCG